MKSGSTENKGCALGGEKPGMTAAWDPSKGGVWLKLH